MCTAHLSNKVLLFGSWCKKVTHGWTPDGSLNVLLRCLDIFLWMSSIHTFGSYLFNTTLDCKFTFSPSIQPVCLPKLILIPCPPGRDLCHCGWLGTRESRRTQCENCWDRHHDNIWQRVWSEVRERSRLEIKDKDWKLIQTNQFCADHNVQESVGVFNGDSGENTSINVTIIAKLPYLHVGQVCQVA